MLTETIKSAFESESEAEASVSDIEAASMSYLTSVAAADMIASLNDHTDEQIGRMVRDGVEAALARQREWRRMCRCMSGIHGDGLAECDANGGA